MAVTHPRPAQVRVRLPIPHARGQTVMRATWYVGQQTARGTVIVVYGDKQSRFDGTPEVGIEIRLSGKLTLGKHGIRSMADVAKLDGGRIITMIGAATEWRNVDWSKLARRCTRPCHRLGTPFGPRSREAITERGCRG